MIYIVGIVIPIILFLFESYPRFFNQYFGVDVWTRLAEIDHVRKNHHRVPKKIKKGFIIEGYFDYPPLFPLILSFIPKRTLEKTQGFIAPFFDSIHCLVIFLIAYQLTNRIDIALVSQLIYLFTPLVILENSYLTPRSFGYLNFTLALYPLLLYMASPKIIYLIVGVIFSVLIFLTHRFATQSFLLAVIFFSLIEKTFFYTAIFLFAGLCATILTKGYYLKVLKGHWYNIFFWIKNYKYRFANQIKGNAAKTPRDIIGKMYYILGTFSPITLIGTNIWLLSAFLFILMRAYNIDILQIQNPMFYKMSLWVVFFYLFAVIVLSFKKLIPIGEGQRYVEMATAPIAILSSIALFSFLNTEYRGPSLFIFGAFIVINLSLILFIQKKGIIDDTNRTLTDNMKHAFKFINKLPGTPRIMCIPHQITTMTVYNTRADVLVNADNPGLMKLTDFYPVLKMPVVELARKYNLDYLLLRETFAKTEDLKIKKPNIIYRSGDILILKL